ncbi:hypothetical protein RHMOL_Rhmol05G0176700 [Rhododendron molle]|uniref:Uncharacterized protein n=1 Tax=Rhododendron molle TaxID=49168 RepID=A0ACC0NRR5_RHOML|nr:hypothetical protein RHMOL_Rhmol05G0176700 [Rhododendron molle]
MLISISSIIVADTCAFVGGKVAKYLPPLGSHYHQCYSTSKPTLELQIMTCRSWLVRTVQDCGNHCLPLGSLHLQAIRVNAGTVVGVYRRWQSRRAVTVMFAAVDPLASQFLPSQSNVVSLVTCSPLQYQG